MNKFNDLSVPDIDTVYECGKFVKPSSGFTYLMKLVSMADRYSETIPIIENLVKDNINAQNNSGYTALMIA